MEARQIFRSGLVAIALSLPFSSCSNTEPLISTQTQTQVQDEVSGLRVKLEKSEKELKEKQSYIAIRDEEFKKLSDKLNDVVRQRDRYEAKLSEYPRDCPEDIITIDKTMRQDMWKLNATMEIGSVDYARLTERVRRLTISNALKDRQIDSARDVLERLRPPVYLSDRTGKPIPSDLTPFALEQNKNAELKLRLENLQTDYGILGERYRKLEGETWKKANILLGEKEETIKTIADERTLYLKQRDGYKKASELWEGCARRLGYNGPIDHLQIPAQVQLSDQR